MGRAWITKCSNFHPNSLPQETRQEIPHDPSQKDMEAAANQSTLPFLQWSKPKEMIPAPFAEGIVTGPKLLTAFSRFTVYNPQSTYINLHVKDLNCLQTDVVQHLKNIKVLPNHTKSRRNNNHGTAYSEVIQGFGVSTSSQYLMGASPSGFQIACFLASQPTPM